MIQSQTDVLRYQLNTVKLGNKELFDKEQIGVKEPVTKCQFTSKR